MVNSSGSSCFIRLTTAGHSELDLLLEGIYLKEISSLDAGLWELKIVDQPPLKFINTRVCRRGMLLSVRFCTTPKSRRKI